MIKLYYDVILGLTRWEFKAPYVKEPSKKRRKRKQKG